MNPSVTTPTIHGECRRLESRKSLRSQMVSRFHRSDDPGESLEFHTLPAEQGLSFEERDDLGQEVTPLAHHQHQGGVGRAAMIVHDAPTPQPLSHEIDNLSSGRVLATPELGDELPSERCARIALERDMKRSFSVDIACQIGI